MSKTKQYLMRVSAITLTVISIISCMLGSTVAYASNTSLPVSANVYDLDKDSHYVIGEASPSASSAIGVLSVDGAVKASGEVNLFPAYEVSNGTRVCVFLSVGGTRTVIGKCPVDTC